ncbi:MAG: AAA family ATPase [Lysobacterales bacterium]|nr:AAA family ATPase [Xanthomonadales bacterium]MCB1611997.1 AAA family ATPase [Xanthomonadales bacterium]MCP5473921.1 AAA family ATPase [Rhodanobacteraceae bacterium]
MLALCPPAGHAPLVLALMGLPGAGKSSLARLLSEATRWSILDRDQIRAELYPGDASAAARLEADRLLLRRAGSGVRAAMNLIIDGKTFALKADRDLFEDAVDEAGGQLQWCWLDLPVEEAMARVRRDSAHPAPDRDPDLVEAVAARFEPPHSHAWRLDAQRTPRELQRQLVLLLAERLNAIVIDDRDAGFSAGP